MWLFNLAHDHVDLWNGEYLPPNMYMSTHEYRITEFEVQAVGKKQIPMEETSN
jgi:hypothetical protein